DVLFLQAEDGIRVRNVTGVQTCALPISDRRRGAAVDRRPHEVDGPQQRPGVGPSQSLDPLEVVEQALFGADAPTSLRDEITQQRSEERRGGEEGGAGRSGERTTEKQDEE